MGYLDNAGLSHLWSKVKSAINAAKRDVKMDTVSNYNGQMLGSLTVIDEELGSYAMVTPQGTVFSTTGFPLGVAFLILGTNVMLVAGDEGPEGMSLYPLTIGDAVELDQAVTLGQMQEATCGPFPIIIDFVGEYAIGHPYTVSRGNEVYSSIVDTLTGNVIFLKEKNEEYIVTCDGITRTIQSPDSDCGIVPRLSFIYMKCEVDVLTNASSTKLVASRGSISVEFYATGPRSYHGTLYDPGRWTFTLYSGETAITYIQRQIAMTDMDISVEIP